MSPAGRAPSPLFEGDASWRLIDPDAPARRGSANMAIDETLLRSVKAGGLPTLRLYRWEPGCLSFGRNQPAAGLYDAAAAAARGIDIVRRPTGGQAVFHHHELTYSVAVPVGSLGGPRETYRAVNGALVAGLRTLGVGAVVVGDELGRRRDGVVHGGTGQRDSRMGAAPPPLRSWHASGGDTMAGRDWLAPCFSTPAPGEVVVGGRKLIGSAQRCEDRVILQHGSILLAGDQSPVRELLLRPTRSGAETPPATLAELLDPLPDVAALAAAVTAGFASALGIRLAPAALSGSERDMAAALEPVYASDGWTWRR